jgi:hypothetical protein
MCLWTAGSEWGKARGTRAGGMGRADQGGEEKETQRGEEEKGLAREGGWGGGTFLQMYATAAGTTSI